MALASADIFPGLALLLSSFTKAARESWTVSRIMVLSWSIVRSLTCIAMGEVLQGMGFTIVAHF